eukprot:EG_transcript_15942
MRPDRECHEGHPAVPPQVMHFRCTPPDGSEAQPAQPAQPCHATVLPKQNSRTASEGPALLCSCIRSPLKLPLHFRFMSCRYTAPATHCITAVSDPFFACVCAAGTLVPFLCHEVERPVVCSTQTPPPSSYSP